MPLTYSWQMAGQAVSPAAPATFPLSVNSGGRYLQTPAGTPFLVVGDTPWSIAVNCTTSQIDSYLNDRAAKGCTAILFNAIEKSYSSQTPAYRNAAGNDPFTVMSPVNWVMNSAYWAQVDYVVLGCKSRGIVPFIAPAYTGYGSGSDGWENDYSGASDATMQAYGVALANRYADVVWVMGGDDANDGGAVGAYGSGTTPNRTKQWQIILGIRSVRTTNLVTGHTDRNGNGSAVAGESYNAWNSGYTGWNLNNIYGHDNNDDAVTLAATAYGRSGPLPFFLIEAGYQDIDGTNAAGRQPACQSFFGGGLSGFFGGHDALWHMGSYPPNNSGAGSVLSTYLASSWTDFQYLGALLKAYSWHLLRPETGTNLVTTALGSGATAICPALATDGSFAMIYTPSVSFTVNMAAITHGSVRGRWYDVTTGVYSSASGSPYANTGTQAFTAPGERVLVLD